MCCNAMTIIDNQKVKNCVAQYSSTTNGSTLFCVSEISNQNQPILDEKTSRKRPRALWKTLPSSPAKTSTQWKWIKWWATSQIQSGDQSTRTSPPDASILWKTTPANGMKSWEFLWICKTPVLTAIWSLSFSPSVLELWRGLWVNFSRRFKEFWLNFSSTVHKMPANRTWDATWSLGN